MFPILVIESQNRANKDRLRNLQKARLVFQDHLGLEIRTIIDKTQKVKGKPSRLGTALSNTVPQRWRKLLSPLYFLR